MNRSWRDKPAGLIVDYLGIADNLRHALASYSDRDQHQAGVPIEQAAAKLVEKHEVLCALLHGHDWTERARSTDSGQRIAQLTATTDFVVADPDRKRRFADETLALVKAFSLAVPHEPTARLRDDVAFFQAVRGYIAKLDAGGTTGRISDEELDTAISQLLSETITAEGVVDIYAQAGIAKPDLSILSAEFLDQLQHQPHKNLQMEALKKLLNDEVRSMRRSKVVQYRRFSEMLEQAIRYQNRALSTAEVIAELVELAKEMQAAQHRGDDLGSTPTRSPSTTPSARTTPRSSSSATRCCARSPASWSACSSSRSPSTGPRRKPSALGSAPRSVGCCAATSTRPTSRKPPSNSSWSKPTCSRTSGAKPPSDFQGKRE